MTTAAGETTGLMLTSAGGSLTVGAPRNLEFRTVYGPYE